MPTISTLTVDVVTDTSRLQSGLSSASSKVKAFGAGVSRAGTSLTKGLTLPLVGLGVVAVKAFGEAETAQAQTRAAIESTGGAARVTANHVNELAGSIAAMSGVDDEAIQAGENMLLTFTNIQNGVGKANKVFDQSTKTLIDMSVALGTDAKTSAIQLGKALNDPINGITALRRVGVTFTKEQEQSIQSFMNHNNIMGAQKVILAELSKEFGGSAEAMGKTSAGMLGIAKVQLGDMLETLGKVIIENVLPVFQKLVGWLQQGAEWFNKLSPGMKDTIVQIAAVVAAVGPVLFIFGKLTSAVGSVIGIVGKLTTVLMANPYLLIIAATIAIAILIVKNWDTIKEFLSKAWAAIVDAAKFFWDHVAIFIIGPMKLVIDFLIDHWRGFKTFFLAIWDAIRDAIGPIVGAIVGTIKGIIDVLMDVIDAIKATIGWFKSLAESSAGGGVAGSTNPGRGPRPPSFQHGGVMSHTGLAFLHAGETVVPAGAGGGLTIIINGDVTGEEIIKKVRDGLLRLAARNGTTGL